MCIPCRDHFDQHIMPVSSGVDIVRLCVKKYIFDGSVVRFGFFILKKKNTKKKAFVTSRNVDLEKLTVSELDRIVFDSDEEGQISENDEVIGEGFTLIDYESDNEVQCPVSDISCTMVNDSVISVSYTHLDVYKRQVYI